jgi:hypothetical protein
VGAYPVDGDAEEVLVSAHTAEQARKLFLVMHGTAQLFVAVELLELEATANVGVIEPPLGRGAAEPSCEVWRHLVKPVVVTCKEPDVEARAGDVVIELSDFRQ